MRLDKYLTDCKIGTRTEVKKLIKSGQITVNDQKVTKPEFSVNLEADIISYMNKPVCYEKYHYYIFNKPGDCVTAKQDNLHKTIMDYFPNDFPKDIVPVGRLDLDTEGLLILTNDGNWNHQLMSPKHHVPKTYLATLDKAVSTDAILKFSEGIDIGDDKPTKPAVLELIENEEHFLAKLTITEGRFHQVKRMFHAIGCEVVKLQRIQIGQLTLEDLELGEYKKLSEQDIKNKVLRG